VLFFRHTQPFRRPKNDLKLLSIASPLRRPTICDRFTSLLFSQHTLYFWFFRVRAPLSLQAIFPAAFSPQQPAILSNESKEPLYPSLITSAIIATPFPPFPSREYKMQTHNVPFLPFCPFSDSLSLAPPSERNFLFPLRRDSTPLQPNFFRSKFSPLPETIVILLFSFSIGPFPRRERNFFFGALAPE